MVQTSEKTPHMKTQVIRDQQHSVMWDIPKLHFQKLISYGNVLCHFSQNVLCPMHLLHRNFCLFWSALARQTHWNTSHQREVHLWVEVTSYMKVGNFWGILSTSLSEQDRMQATYWLHHLESTWTGSSLLKWMMLGGFFLTALHSVNLSCYVGIQPFNKYATYQKQHQCRWHCHRIMCYLLLEDFQHKADMRYNWTVSCTQVITFFIVIL